MPKFEANFKEDYHIAISQIWRKSLLDKKNEREADIGSDHHLFAELRLKISASKKPFIAFNKKFDVQKLRSKEIQKNLNKIRKYVSITAATGRGVRIEKYKR
jgi:hypothetical protein